MYHIIANPNARSGKGAAKWRALKKALTEAKLTYVLHLTKSAEDTTGYTRQITAYGLYEQNNTPHRIIVLGGDGTLNCVLCGIEDIAHTQVAYLPAGTSNDFAHAMHYDTDPEHAIEALSAQGSSHLSDLGVVDLSAHNSRRFGVSCGIGYDAAICAEADTSPAKKILNRLGLGKLIYVSVALRQLKDLKPAVCRLYLDDRDPITVERFYFAACMQLPCEGGGFHFCPKADNTDGLLDICVAGNISKLYALTLFPLAAKGRHISKKGITYYRCKQVRIETDTPQYVHTDGEVCGKYSRISLRTHDLKLNFRLPADKS